MNIKGLIGNSLTPAIRPTEKVERTIRSDTAHDRDPSGQQAFDEKEKHHEPMSDELLEKAMEHLRSLPAVKEHKWTIELLLEETRKFVLVKDNLGTVIRRIPELDLWTLPMAEELPKGNLLKKTA